MRKAHLSYSAAFLIVMVKIVGGHDCAVLLEVVCALWNEFLPAPQVALPVAQFIQRCGENGGKRGIGNR